MRCNCLCSRLFYNNRQAVTKDLTSSSNFSGSCVLTFQTLPGRWTLDLEMDVFFTLAWPLTVTKRR